MQARVAGGDLEAGRQLFEGMGPQSESATQAAAQAEALTSLATAIALQGGREITVCTAASMWYCLVMHSCWCVRAECAAAGHSPGARKYCTCAAWLRVSHGLWVQGHSVHGIEYPPTRLATLRGHHVSLYPKITLAEW